MFPKKLAYQTFRFSSSVQRRLSRRTTPAGMLVLAALAASALLGIDTNRTLAHQAFTLLFSLIAVSIVCSLFFKGRFSFFRNLPRYATVGKKLSYRIRIKNRTKKNQSGLSLMEDLSDPRPSFEEFLNAVEPGEEKRNWLDRYFGAYRWQWLLSRKQRGRVEETSLSDILPEGGIEVRMEFIPLRRGIARFTGFSVARADPLGLFKSIITQPLEQSLIVLPKRYPTPSLRLPGSRQYNQGGVVSASEVGDSEEFVSMRDYRPGDPLRHIHWKSWAKTGEPVVKEFEDEYFTRHALILDTFTNKEETELFEDAVSVAASFVSDLETRDTLLDLMFVGAEAYCFTSGRSLAHADRMLEILASVHICKDKPFGFLRNKVMERLPLLSGCICVLLSWDEERRNFIERIKAHGIFLSVLVITGEKPASPIDPGPMRDSPSNFHVLESENIAEGMADISFQ